MGKLASDGAQAAKKITTSYWNANVNPFKTLPKDAPMRGKEQLRPQPSGSYNNNDRGNYGGGFRGRGGLGGNRGGMGQNNYNNRNFHNGNSTNNNGMGFNSNNNMGVGGFNGPMGGGNFGFNNRGNMMGGGMRGGPGGMRGNRGGGNMMGMPAMGGMPMGMPGNMAMMGMGGGMPGKSSLQVLCLEGWNLTWCQAFKEWLPTLAEASDSDRTRAEAAVIGAILTELSDLGQSESEMLSPEKNRRYTQTSTEEQGGSRLLSPTWPWLLVCSCPSPFFFLFSFLFFFLLASCSFLFESSPIDTSPSSVTLQTCTTRLFAEQS